MGQEPEKTITKEELDRKLADTDTPVYTFEAEASPEEKAKQTLKNSGIASGNASGTVAEKVEKVTALLPKSIPEWTRTGWQRVSNIGAEEDIFDNLLGDLYLGKLWLNASVVFVSIFVTYIITSIGGGIGWVIIISAIVGTRIFFNCIFAIFKILIR